MKIMKPISPIALILWHYKQGSQLNTEERKQLIQWTEQSEDRKMLMNDLISHKKWIELTLKEFLLEFELSVAHISLCLKKQPA
jgi:hypothetical protein